MTALMVAIGLPLFGCVEQFADDAQGCDGA